MGVKIQGHHNLERCPDTGAIVNKSETLYREALETKQSPTLENRVDNMEKTLEIILAHVERLNGDK